MHREISSVFNELRLVCSPESNESGSWLEEECAYIIMYRIIYVTLNASIVLPLMRVRVSGDSVVVPRML